MLKKKTKSISSITNIKITKILLKTLKFIYISLQRKHQNHL